MLNEDDVGRDFGVAIEYTIPQSSKRVDFIISGYDGAHVPTLIIVELKQWSSSVPTSKDGIIIAKRGGRGPDVEGTHPCYQAWSYAAMLKGFNETIYSQEWSLLPCAYLHNHPANGTIDAKCYSEQIRVAPLFLKGEAERERFRKFITQHIRYGDASKLIEIVEQGKIRPSKALAESIGGMLKGNQEFVLVDDQKVVYENVLAIAAIASKTGKKVVIIEGGPGTGKSVIAINLLAELTKRGLLTKYVSKNAAPRAVYRAKLTKTFRQTEISSFFSGSGAFIDTEPNLFDVLVVDEAHRLNEKSGLYGNLGDHQVRELIRASQCSVFFIDESQRVTFSDIGRIAEIESAAAHAGADCLRYELSSQFRCAGSDGYIAWLDKILEIRTAANATLDPKTYDFRVFDSATELHAAIKSCNDSNNRSRVVAGYCWDWVSKKNPNQFDIILDEGKYRRRWNLTEDGSLWIIAANSIDEIGCVHTCQGLEVDYVGVILGPDLVVRDGKIQSNYRNRAAADRRKSLGGIEKWRKSDPDVALAAADQIIKNTYRTLMSRGMKGCYIYSVDSETRAYFSEQIGRIR